MRKEPLDFVQFSYNIENRVAEERLLPLAQERGIATIINRPYQRGALFQKSRGVDLPGLAKELGLHQLGPVLPQVHHRPPGGHLPDTCHVEAASHERQYGGELRPRANDAQRAGMIPDLRGAVALMSRLRSPAAMLLAMAFVMPMTFSVWNALLNNFVVEQASFTGREIGMLQSLREIPGFLAFTVVFLLVFIREQRLALLSLFLMSVGVAVTGQFPTILGLYITTVIMSIGFHYFEALNESLTLQWIDKRETAHFMGRARR